MKRITNALVLALGLLASTSLFAQTAVVQALQNVTNRAGTYTASSSYILAATPTDIAILNGSATKTVFVKKLLLSCNLTTAAQTPVILYKRSNANAVHVSQVLVTAAQQDSTDAAPTATFVTYTSTGANSSQVGSGVQIDSERLAMLAPGTAAGGSTVMTRHWGLDMDKYIVLRGVAQGLAINMAGATLTGGACSVTVTWMER